MSPIRFIKTSLFLICLLLFGCQPEPKELPVIDGFVLPSSKPIGPFALKTADGKPFNELSFKNHWSLLFFGFTNCPDVCPTTLVEMSKLADKLAKMGKLENTRFYFVSLDPNRDDLKKLKQYVTFFHPDFQGLTGTEKQLHIIATQLGIAYTKVFSQDDPNQYMLEHGSAMIVLNPDAEYQAFFRYPHDADKIAQQLVELQAFYKK